MTNISKENLARLLFMKERLSLLLVVLVLLGLPIKMMLTQNNVVSLSYVDLRFFETILVLCALLLVTLFDRDVFSRVGGYIPSWVKVAILLLFVVLILTALFSPLAKNSLFMHMQWPLYFLLTLFAIDASQKHKLAPVYAGYAIVFGCLFYAFFYALYLVRMVDVVDGVENLSRFMFPYLNYIRAAGIFWGCGFLVTLLMLSDEKIKKNEKRLLLVLLVMFLFLVFWTATRTAIVSLIATYLLLSIFDDKLRKLRMLLYFLLAVFSALLLLLLLSIENYPESYGLSRIVSQSSGDDINSISSGRFYIWGEYIKYLADHWIVGTGEASHPLVMNPPGFGHPENMIFYFWVNWGFIGLSISLLLIGWVLWGSYQLIRKMPIKVEILISVGVVLYVLFAAQIEAGFLRAIDRAWMFAFSGFILGFTLNKKVTVKDTALVKMRDISLCLLFATSVMVSFIYFFIVN